MYRITAINEDIGSEDEGEIENQVTKEAEVCVAVTHSKVHITQQKKFTRIN